MKNINAKYFIFLVKICGVTCRGLVLAAEI